MLAAGRRPAARTGQAPAVYRALPCTERAFSVRRTENAALLHPMPDDPRERHFNIQTTPEAMAGVYANFANVSHSDYEFTVTFARVDHEIEEGEVPGRSEEHTSELQSRQYLVCRLLLE